MYFKICRMVSGNQKNFQSSHRKPNAPYVAGNRAKHTPEFVSPARSIAYGGQPREHFSNRSHSGQSLRAQESIHRVSACFTLNIVKLSKATVSKHGCVGARGGLRYWQAIRSASVEFSWKGSKLGQRQRKNVQKISGIR